MVLRSLLCRVMPVRKVTVTLFIRLGHQRPPMRFFSQFFLILFLFLSPDL